MVTRIVKLQFQEDKIEGFLSFFEEIKQNVNQFDNCYGMQLLRDVKNPTTIFTYSKWEDEAALNAYRNSDTFGKVWPKIKPWFAAKPEAWTVEEHFDGFEVR